MFEKEPWNVRPLMTEVLNFLNTRAARAACLPSGKKHLKLMPAHLLLEKKIVDRALRFFFFRRE